MLRPWLALTLTAFSISVTLAALHITFASATDPPAPIAFRDVAAESGIRFRFDNGSRGKHDLPEIMGGGVALIDADGDGRLDIYLCNGGPIEVRPGQPDP